MRHRAAAAVMACGLVVWSERGVRAQDRGPSALLTLRSALAEALAGGPDLQSRADAVKAADIRRELAASQFGLKITPQFGLASNGAFGSSRSAGVSLAKQLSTGAQTFVTVSSYALGLDGAGRDTGVTIGISQPLLRGFSRTARAGLVDAERAGSAAKHEWTAARAALIVHVTSQYFDVIKRQKLLAAAEQAALRATSLTAASQARTRVGLATELDVLRAQVLESRLSAAVAAAAESLIAARDRLALAIGRGPDASLDVAPVDTTHLPASFGIVEEPLEDLVRTAAASRVEAVEARERVRDAARRASIARWNLLPPIALDVSYTRRGIGSSPATGLIVHSFLDGWHVGLNTSYSLDQSAERAAAATADLSIGAAERAARAVEQGIAAEVRRLHRAWVAAASTIAIQQKAVDLAGRQLRLAEIRYERGLADNFDVVDAQTSVLQARSELITAELDRIVLALDLRRAAGLLDAGALIASLVN